MFYNKKIGETTSEFAKRISFLHNGKKTCACGKLDPMARGTTRVLIGDDTKKMESHLSSDKTYEFYIALGISTDSDDIMGIVDDYNLIDSKKIIEVKNYMNTVISNLQSQKFHHYSAIRLKKNGKRQPLWYWYNLGLLDESEIPEKKVKVYNLDFLEFDIVDYQKYKSIVMSRLDKITLKTKFRIDKIKNFWNSIGLIKNVYLLKYKIKVSSGFYVRMIAKSIKKDLGIPVHIYDINRTKVD